MSIEDWDIAAGTYTTHDLCNMLRGRGFAVVVFSPDELEHADASQVEDVMIERAWSLIEYQNSEWRDANEESEE